MNKYKKLVFNTGIFAIGTFGSKILIILLSRLYAHNMDAANNGVTLACESVICNEAPDDDAKAALEALAKAIG